MPSRNNDDDATHHDLDRTREHDEYGSRVHYIYIHNDGSTTEYDNYDSWIAALNDGASGAFVPTYLPPGTVYAQRSLLSRRESWVHRLITWFKS